MWIEKMVIMIIIKIVIILKQVYGILVANVYLVHILAIHVIMVLVAVTVILVDMEQKDVELLTEPLGITHIIGFHIGIGNVNV